MTLINPGEHMHCTNPAGEQAASTPTHGGIGRLSSDEELQQAVCAALMSTAGLDASGIEVLVLGHGEVTLLGHVATAQERNQALRVARQCAGCRVVHADLALAPSSA